MPEGTKPEVIESNSVLSRGEVPVLGRDEATVPASPRFLIEPPIVEVYIYGDIGAVAGQRGLRAEFETWVMARALDVRGSGWLPRDELVKGIVEHFGLSKKRAVARVAQAAAEGTFLRKGNKGHVSIMSPLYVGRKFGMTGIRRPIRLPASEFVGTQRRRAAIYQAFLTPRQKAKLGRYTKPISREAIDQATGFSPDSQRRYEKVADIKVVTNMLKMGRNPAEDLKPLAPGLGIYVGPGGQGYCLANGAEYPGFPYWKYEDGYWRQIGNSYSTNLVTCCKKKVRRVNEQLGLLGRRANALGSIYFYDEGAAARACVHNYAKPTCGPRTARTARMRKSAKWEEVGSLRRFRLEAIKRKGLVEAILSREKTQAIACSMGLA